MYSRSGTFQSAIFIRSSRKIFFSNWKTIELFVFASKRLFCRQETFVVFNLLPSRQTLPRHTGTPPVSQSDELSILIRLSVLISDTVVIGFYSLFDYFLSSKAVQPKVSIIFCYTFHVYTVPSLWPILILDPFSLFDRGSPHSRPPGPDP